MSSPQVPMLHQSTTFVRRLSEASRFFGDSRYLFHRRVNWSYRYDTQFQRAETDLFIASPADYLAGRQVVAPQVQDVLVLRLSYQQLAKTLLKVAVHWLFYLLGRFADDRITRSGASIYRKAYVDDIEKVFEPDQAGVVRAVFPFPLNLRRQLRYLRYLRDKGYPFKLDGNPYSLKDVMRVLWRRDVRSLLRMESRAEMRHAREVVALGVKTVQLSDEFNIGSLDFCRALARFPVRVVNSAHGVGKYFPVHAYQEFHVITERQAQYYFAIRPCKYTMRVLNENAGVMDLPQPRTTDDVVHFVFLSQVFHGVGEVIATNEALAIKQLSDVFKDHPKVKLFYKPHPNCYQSIIPIGFQRLLRLDEVNGQPGTVYASFFSTCHIDPSFKGKKVLLRGHLIYPEIVFDESETIVDIHGLVSLIMSQAGT